MIHRTDLVDKNALPVEINADGDRAECKRRKRLQGDQILPVLCGHSDAVAFQIQNGIIPIEVPPFDALQQEGLSVIVLFREHINVHVASVRSLKKAHIIQIADLALREISLHGKSVLPCEDDFVFIFLHLALHLKTTVAFISDPVIDIAQEPCPIPQICIGHVLCTVRKIQREILFPDIL